MASGVWWQNGFLWQAEESAMKKRREPEAAQEKHPGIAK